MESPAYGFLQTNCWDMWVWDSCRQQRISCCFLRQCSGLSISSSLWLSELVPLFIATVETCWSINIFGFWITKGVGTLGLKFSARVLSSGGRCSPTGRMDCGVNQVWLEERGVDDLGIDAIQATPKFMPSLELGAAEGHSRMLLGPDVVTEWPLLTGLPDCRIRWPSCSFSTRVSMHSL